jgi:F420-non-reducing hydrogenase iron-sulfur subunit
VTEAGEEEQKPRILVFATNTISDPGIDLAGSSHMHYPTGVRVVTVPCSSAIKPEWIVYAIERGFDGVFIASDGTDCPYLPDCTARTARIADRAQELLKSRGGDPRRIKLAAICSVCAEPFVNHMKNFAAALGQLAPAGRAS